MSKKVRKVSRIDDPNIEAQIDEIIRVVNSLDARTEEADAKATVNTQPKLVFREFPSDPVFGNCEFVYDVTLRWYKAEGAVMYEIRTDLNWGNESGRVYLGSALQYSFIPGQRYYTFYIKSINPAGKYSQGYDEIILEKPVPSIPDPPEAMPFFSAVKIIPAPNHEQGILGHYAYVTIEGETDKVDIPIGSSHVYNAPSGTEMTIEMSAYDILGEGGKSAPVTASTLKLSDRDIPEEIIEPSNLVKSLREDIDLTKTRAIDALAQISDLDSIVDDTIADLNAAKGRLTSAETEISNAKNRISTVETKIGEIDDEIESAKDRLTSAETEITGAKNRLDSVETEVAGAKSRLSDAEDKLGTIDVEIAGAKERISDAETDLLDAKNRLSDVEDEIVDTKDRLLGAESRLSSFDDEIADAKDRLTDAESRLTATETDLTDAKTRLTSVEESITDAEARLVDAENRLSSIDDEIADAKDRLTDAELRLTAAETDLTDARTRLIEAENDLEGLEGVVSTHETKISNVEGELSTKVSQTEFNALAGTVSTQGTILAQHADQIAMKAEQSEVDTLSEAVANNTATLEVHATQIAARVTKEVYNLLENRVEEAEAELVALADEISAKVSQTVFEDLQSRVTANEAELLVQAEAIQARVTQEVYDTLANRVTTVEGTLEVLPEQIALKASQSDVDALTGRVEDAEAELLVLATEISSKVSQTVFDSLSEAVTSQGTQITQNAAAIESKADQSVVDALSGTVAEHSTLISQTAEAIETKADKSVVDTLSDTVSSHTSTLQQHANMIAARVTTEVFNALEDRVEANEAELIVLADEISSKVSQSVFDALEQRVTTNEGTLAVHADMIAARVTSEVFDLLEERVETAEGQLTVLADEVSAKVSQTVFDALAGRVETTEGILEVLPDQINAKADQSVVDTLTERVEEAEGQLSVLATEIAARVTQTVFDELEGRVASNEGELTVLADEISSKVSQSVFDTLAGRVSEAEGQLTVLAGEIEARVKQSVFDELVGRVEDAEATLTVLPGQIAAKADKTTVQQIDDELNTVKSNVATLTTNYDGIVARVEEVEGDINSLDDEITDVKSITGQLEVRAGKIEASVSAIEEDVDDHGNRLASVENAVVEVLPGQIALKADQSEVDILTGRVEDTEATLVVLATEISSKVSQTVFDTLSETVTSQGTQITQNATAIESKADQSVVDALSGTVSNHSTLISQNATAITQKADKSTVDALTGRVSAAEATLTTHADAIEARATKEEVDAIEDRVTAAEGQLSVQAGKIEAKAEKSEVQALEEDLSAVSNQVSTLTTSYDSISARVEAVEGVTDDLTDEVSDVKSRTGSLELRADNIEASVSSLEENVDEHGNRLLDVEHAVVNVLPGQIELKANASDVYTKAQVNTELGKKADKTDVDDLTARVSNAELTINAHEGAIAQKAERTEVYTKTETDAKLGTKVDITTYNQKVGELTTSIEGITGRVSNIEDTIDDHGNRLASVENAVVEVLPGQIALKADASIVDEQGTRITAAEQNISALDGAITQAVTRINQSAILKPTGGKLWHFDTSLESTDGIKPLEGAVATLRHDEGRFGGAVAVEEGTTNLFPSEKQGEWNTWEPAYITHELVTSGQWAGWYKVTAKRAYEGDVDGQIGYVSFWVGVDSLDFPAGEGEVTASIDFYCEKGNVVPVVYGDWIGDMKQVSKYRWRETYYVSQDSSSSTTIYFKDTKVEEGTIDAVFYYRRVQYELKPFATSFVDGTRPDGILAYPIALKDDYTIACYRKSHTDEDYKHVVKRSDGKVFVDGVEDSGYDVGWIAGSDDCLMFSNQTGLIDELLILPYAATEDEIQQWYRTTAPFYDPAELGFVGSQVQQLADKWTVTIQKTVDDKNVATGFGLAIGEDDISEFAVLADRFRVFGSLDEEGDGTALFVVDAQTNKAYLNVEEVIAAGAIKAEHLEADSVLAYLVQAGFAQFDEANVLDLLVDRRIRVGDNLEIGGNRIVVEGYETFSETVWITEDVYVDGEDSTDHADRNYSYSTYLDLDDGVPKHTLLKFNLPSGNITSATLRLYGVLYDSSPFYIRALKGDWDYQTVTWNNRPASDLIITTPTYQENENYHWIEIDITPVIQLWEQGQQNYGIEVYYSGDAGARSSRYSNPTHHPHVVFTVSSEEKMPKAVFGDLEGLDWLDKTLPAGEHGFWGKGVRIIGDIASADKEGNYSVLSGGRLAFFRATQWDEHGNPIAHSKAMYPAQLVSGTANSGQVVDLYAQGYRFLSEPKIIVFPNFNRTYLANHQGQDVWINWKVEAVDDDTPIFNHLTGAVKFRVRVETTVKGGDDLAAENSLTRRRLQGTGELSTAEGETGSGATSLRVKCTSYLRLRREYEDGFYYYQGHQEYWVYYRRKGTSQWKFLGEHSHWDYRFGSPSGTPPIVNESKVFEVPLSPAGVYEIRVVLTTWGLYDSYVYIDAFKYRSQDTISSVDESEMVNYLVIDGG